MTDTLEIVKKANSVIKSCGSRDPYRIAKELGIEIIPRNFKHQKGAYKVLMRNRFIFIKNDLNPVMAKIVLLHEIGHDILHQSEATTTNQFCLEIIICRVCRSFDYLIYPYYPAYTG